MEINARLTRRDNDIKDGLRRLSLKKGEVLSDVVREGARLILKQRGALKTIDDISTAIEPRITP